MRASEGWARFGAALIVVVFVATVCLFIGTKFDRTIIDNVFKNLENAYVGSAIIIVIVFGIAGICAIADN